MVAMMSSNALFVVAGLFVVTAAVALIVFSVIVYAEFTSYCKDVAKSENRLTDFYSVRNVDENNLNEFERRLFKRLMNDDLHDLKGEVLLLRGRRLAYRLRLARALTVAFVTIIAALYLLWPKG